MLGGMLAAFLAFQVEALFGGAICAVIVAVFVISILIAIWVYRDAESRGMSGALWLIIILIAGIIGLIIYLVVRKDRVQPMAPMMTPQPWSPPGAPPPSPPSGQAAGAAASTCRNCGSPLAPGATFCGKCGAKV